MAIRNLRFGKDPVLHRESRTVEKIDDTIKTLVEDMYDTMYANDGVGLAAPQVGISKKVIVIDTGNEGEVCTMINPEILESSGADYEADEGCLSYPKLFGKISRKPKVKAKGLDINGEEIIIEAEGLYAQAFQHEVDHINGTVFVDNAKDDKYYMWDSAKQKGLPVNYDKSEDKVYPKDK